MSFVCTEKFHKLSIVPYEIGRRLGRGIVLFLFAWVSSVCWLSFLLTVLTFDKQHLQQGFCFLPWDRPGNKINIICSNKQDGIHCWPHQLKYVPGYSMRIKWIVLWVWLNRCQWRQMNSLAALKSLVSRNTTFQSTGLLNTITEYGKPSIN